MILKKGKLISAAVISGLLCMGLSGCGASEFDAAGYVNSVLDANYHDEYAQYAEFRQITEEEAEEELNLLVDTQLLSQAASAGILSDDGVEKYKDQVDQIDKLSKYEVKGAEKQEDDNFIVTIEVEPSDVYQTVEANLTAVAEEKIAEGVDMADQTAYEEMVLEGIQRSIDGNTYGEPATIEVAVTADSSGAYGISDEDMQKIADAMFPE